MVFGVFKVINGVPKSTIARLNSDGTIDNSFNCSVCELSQTPSVLVQPDGKILIGSGGGYGVPIKFFRLNSDGSLDSTFISPFTGSQPQVSYYVRVFAAQPDGKIFASLSSYLPGFGVQNSSIG